MRYFAAAFAFLIHGVVIGQQDSSSNQPVIGGRSGSEILQLLGARLESGLSAEQRGDYARHFRAVDQDGDDRHSKQEYVEEGRYLTKEARRGIFNAADRDADGFVSKSEYISNRVITDEAKTIVQAMDEDNDGTVRSAEFVKHASKKLSDPKLATEVFQALDTNGNGEITIPEYLRVWGQWARDGGTSRSGGDSRRGRGRGGVGLRRGPPSGFGLPGRRAGTPSVDAVFDRFDSDTDGNLTKTEVPEFAQQFIIPADKDGNGLITKIELKSFRESREFGNPTDTERSGRGRFRRGRRGDGRRFGPFSGNTDPVRLNRAGLQVGSELPDTVVFDEHGKEFSTATLKGSYSVVVFGCLT